MGVNYSAIALLGCEVTGKLYRNVTLRRCNHEYPADSAYCPRCGVVAGPIAGAAEAIPGYDAGTNDFEGLPVRHTTDGQRSFIGISTPLTEDAVGVVLDDSADIKVKLRAKLEPHGLWDEATFRMWAIRGFLY